MAIIRTLTVDNIDANGYSGWYKMKLEVHLNSQSIVNNTSNITLKAFFATKTKSAGWYTISHTYLKSSLSINGGAWSQKTSYQIKDMPQNSANVWRQFGSWTGNVTHKADGKQTIDVKLEFTRSSTTSYLPKNASGTSGVFSLTTIPRASTPRLSTSSQNIGSSVTIYTDRASTAFTHTIQYTLGGVTTTVATGVGASYAWTLPNTLANRIPTASSLAGTIKLITYNGSTNLGSKTISFTTKVPSNSTFNPSATGLKASIYGSGRDKTIGKYIQNISRASAFFTATAGYGASISSQSITISGKNYSGTSVTSGVLASSGTITVTANVKDSRGRTASQSITILVVAYSTPVINIFTAKRVSGTTTATVTRKVAYSVLSGDNPITILIRVREKGGIWSNLENESYTVAIDGTKTATALDDTKSYEFEIIATDSFGKKTEAIVTIGTVRVALTVKRNIGIGVGKVWEEEDGSPLQIAERATIDGHRVVFFADYEEW